MPLALLLVLVMASLTWADGWKIMRGSESRVRWRTAVEGQPICGDDVNLMAWASTDVDQDGTMQVCTENMAGVNQANGLVRTNEENQIAVQQLPSPTPFVSHPPIGACEGPQHTWIDEGQLTKLKFGGCPGGSGQNVITDLYVNKLDSVCLDVTCENLPDGEYGTLAFLGAGAISRTGPVITVSPIYEQCQVVQVADSTDNRVFWAFSSAVEIQSVWCHYQGSAPATLASFQMQDGAGNLMTQAADPVCAAPASIATPQVISANNSLNPREVLGYDVPTATPTTATYLLCVSYALSAIQ